jgi:hypothetical protein
MQKLHCNVVFTIGHYEGQRICAQSNGKEEMRIVTKNRAVTSGMALGAS